MAFQRTKCAKAQAEPLAWYITSAIQGQHGGRAALVGKLVKKADVDSDFYTQSSQGTMEAEEWDILVMLARMAKQNITLEEGKQKPMYLVHYYSLLKTKSAGSPGDEVSWVRVKVPSPLVKLANDALTSPVSGRGRELNLKKQFHPVEQNFDKVVAVLQDHKEVFGEGIVDLQTIFRLQLPNEK